MTAAVKETVNASYELSLAEGLRFERRIFHALFATVSVSLSFRRTNDCSSLTRENDHPFLPPVTTERPEGGHGGIR